MTIAGAVLAGGTSARMGGGDKCLLDLGGRSILGHVLERFAPQVEHVALNANGDPARFSTFGLPVIADGDGSGPLAGILAAMRWAGDQGCTHVATVAGDTPFLPGDLVERLGQAAAEPDTIALAESAGGLHPVAGLWPVALADALVQFLRDGVYKVRAFTGLRGSTTAHFDARDGIDPFFNVNTPADHDIARRALAGQQRFGQVVGIAGWKNAGKTTLTERLVAELAGRGRTVSTVKHAHHDFDIDQAGTDSQRHRAAGAQEVAVVSSARWALIRELRGAPEPPFAAVIGSLAPANIVLVEGYKRENHRKIELRRGGGEAGPAAPEFANVVAIATDRPDIAAPVPVFALDDIVALADFVEGLCTR